MTSVDTSRGEAEGMGEGGGCILQRGDGLSSCLGTMQVYS